jgi:phage shock protein PspC (stress-responsive transcriptional regulator)
MNKTIIININGTVFHIEEQAYELLKEYMTDVKRHFFNSADSLEITTDIENRIAEMFTEILAREARQAIIDQDVTAVIEQMGSVKDFESAEQETAGNFTEPNFTMGAGATTRRLFRDPEDHLIGGVCAGIANYFDIKAVWVRLFFAVSFLFAGTGAMVYIILWIIVPKALTRADKMAMKGEPLDLQGFKRNFEAEMSTVGGRLNELRQDARPLAFQTRDFISDFFHHLATFFGGAGKLIIKLLGIAIILACIGGSIAIVVLLFATMVFGDNHFSVPDSFFNYAYINQVRVAFALLTIIPLTMLGIVISSAVFNTTSINRSAGYTLLIIWISSLGILLYHGSRVASEFRDSAGFTQTINLKPTANQVYYLELNETRFLTHEDSTRLNIKTRFNNMVLTDDDDNDDLEPNSMRIEIERSDVPYPVLVEEFTSRGSDYEEALSNARNTRYVFAQQDSVLKFDYKLRRLDNKMWHGEEVKLTLRIPLKATVMVNDKINRYINNSMNLWDCSPNPENRTNRTFSPFVMTTEGLQCKLDSAVTAVQEQPIESSNAPDTVIVVQGKRNTQLTPDTIYLDSTEAPAPARKPVVVRKFRNKQ